MKINKKIIAYIELMRLNKPIGIWLLLWHTLWGLWIAGQGMPPLAILLIFITGTVVMRSAGCVINDYADRNFDKHVKRTQNRPLTAGRVSEKEALILFAVLCFIGLLLVLQLNWLAILLSFVAVLLIIIYPFTKRITYLPQVVLGATFGWSIPMGFAAIQNRVPAIAWLLFIIAILWIVAYDTLYAMVDRDDDKNLPIKSSALLFGKYDRLIIAILQVLVVTLLAILGYILHYPYYFYAGLLIGSILLIYQQRLIKERIPEKCFAAFLNNHWFGMLIFIGILLAN